jgi:hypothetical protein
MSWIELLSPKTCLSGAFWCRNMGGGIDMDFHRFGYISVITVIKCSKWCGQQNVEKLFWGRGCRKGYPDRMYLKCWGSTRCLFYCRKKIFDQVCVTTDFWKALKYWERKYIYRRSFVKFGGILRRPLQLFLLLHVMVGGSLVYQWEMHNLTSKYILNYQWSVRMRSLRCIWHIILPWLYRLYIAWSSLV